MADAAAREPQAGIDVLEFEIRMLPENLFRRHSRGKQLKDVRHPDPHATNAGATATLPGVHRDPVCQFGHIHSLPELVLLAEC